ncbi:hypothetical protein ACFLVP_00505 [Chloroflexota bacterium]
MKRFRLMIVTATICVGMLFNMGLSCSSTLPTETITNSYTVGANPVINVTIGNGSIILVIGGDSSINVEALLLSPDNVTYEVTQDGDTVTIDAVTEHRGRADVTVTLPDNTLYALATGNGGINVPGMNADGQVNIGNGTARLDGVTGDINGNIGNGDFIMINAEGSFIANVGNGNISFKGVFTAAGTNTANIGNGSAIIELTGSPSVAVDLDTDRGTVTSTQEVTITEQSKETLVGTIGGGAATLTVDIGNGNITIK